MWWIALKSVQLWLGSWQTGPHMHSWGLSQRFGQSSHPEHRIFPLFLSFSLFPPFLSNGCGHPKNSILCFFLLETLWIPSLNFSYTSRQCLVLVSRWRDVSKRTSLSAAPFPQRSTLSFIIRWGNGDWRENETTLRELQEKMMRDMNTGQDKAGS